jgi:hypothetical protein
MPDPPSSSLVGSSAPPADLIVERAECLVLIVPEWFQREDFLDWRQGKTESQWCGPACWFPNERTGDYLDVFLTFDRGWPPRQPEPGCEHLWEASDGDGLPEDIYEAIGRILHQQGLHRGIIWIKPL